MNENRRKISVFVLGLRGFPAVQGGVETHAENLYPLVSESDVSVTCATRRRFHNPELSEWRGVKLVPIWAPKSRFLEALVHSVLAVIKAARLRPDIVHIHAVGPALVTPLVRLVGLRAVVTHHGPDYDREKWNRFAKGILRLGEWAGMRFANRRIVITSVIADAVRKRYGADSTIIPNGVPLPEMTADDSTLVRFGLEPHRYVLLVSRFVPEKRHSDLIDGFAKARLNGWKLVLVGDADHPGEYVRMVREKAASNSDVVLTGFLTGDDLKAMYQYAGVFVLPSSHEGLPISLLEALSFGLRCVASSIPANRCVGMEEDAYFFLGDIEDLAQKLTNVGLQKWSEADRDNVRNWIAKNYDWREIAKQTVAVYQDAIT
jgi:glycosyltransferase involved in cell wall biosynthesis